MNRKKIGIFIICFLIGMGIIMQARITDGEKLYASSNTIEEYKANIAGEKDAVAEIKALTKETSDTLEEYQEQKNKEKEESTVKETLEAELRTNKIMAGTEAVQGKGVTITMDDGDKKLSEDQDINTVIVHEADVLRVINDLKSCGAEAISVNGQRVVSTTAISCSGYTIRINGKTYARPFIIQAIGDSKKMTNKLLGAGGYGQALQSWGVIFKMETEKKIKIEAYEQYAEMKYMEPVKGDNGK